MINTKQLSDHLGFIVTIPFITDVLCVEPAKREKKGAFWSEQNVADIKMALVERLNSLPPPAVKEACDDLF